MNIENNHLENKRIILGDEFDETLKDIVVNVIKKIGGKIDSKNWAIGGSQEFDTLKFLIDGKQLIVESETYIGLSIEGESDLVEHIAMLVDKEIGHRG